MKLGTLCWEGITKKSLVVDQMASRKMCETSNTRVEVIYVYKISTASEPHIPLRESNIHLHTYIFDDGEVVFGCETQL